MQPQVNYEKYIHRAATSQETVAPLTQYIRQTPIMHTKIIPVGERSGRVYRMMTEKGKHLIRSFLKALYDFHQAGVCPPRFSDPDIVVVSASGRAKFRDICCQVKTHKLVFLNYQDAQAMLRAAMFHSDAVPEDIDHLLKLMGSNRAIDMEYVIRTHASLVPLGNRFQFYVNMYEQIKFVMDGKPERQRILNALPYRRDWWTRLQGNHLLEESFYSHNPYNTRGGPIVFLDYYRNTLVRRMDKYLKPLKLNPRIILNYTSDDFEKILVVTYPMYLPAIQEELENQNQLRNLNLHLLF